MQGENIQINQIVQLAALALLIGSAVFLGKVCSPGYSSTGSNHEPEGQTELLREFSRLNPEAQRGAIRYIEEMRKGYQKT